MTTLPFFQFFNSLSKLQKQSLVQNLDKCIDVSTNSGSSRTNVISDSGKPTSNDNKGLSKSHTILIDTSANAAPVIDVLDVNNSTKRKICTKSKKSNSHLDRSKRVKMSSEDLISIPTKSGMDEKLKAILNSDDPESTENDSDYDSFFSGLKITFQPWKKLDHQSGMALWKFLPI